MNKHNLFLEAIRNKNKVKVIVDSKEKGRIERHCIPFDYGPSKRYSDQRERYHFYTLDSPEGPHNLSILPEQLIGIEILNEIFEPGDLLTLNHLGLFQETGVNIHNTKYRVMMHVEL